MSAQNQSILHIWAKSRSDPPVSEVVQSIVGMLPERLEPTVSMVGLWVSQSYVAKLPLEL